MFGLSLIDIFVIVVYFAVVLYIGFRAMRNIHSQEDYFLGGRKFGKLIQIFAAFGQGTSADSAVGTATTTFTNGASGIWSSLLYLWGTPLYWFTSPWYRRMRVLTLGDFFEERFGSKRMAGFYAVIASMFLMSCIAIGMKSVTVTVLGITQKNTSELTPAEQTEYELAQEHKALLEMKAWKDLTAEHQLRLNHLEIQKPRQEFSHLNEIVLIWVICVIVFVYAVTGGLEAAMHTDLLQGIFILILSIILIPFGLTRINTVFGGSGSMDAVRTIHDRLPQWYFDIFGAAQTIDFTWYYIISISLLTAVNVAVQANQMNAIGSAKDELTARIGFTAGCFLKRFCTVLWGVTGLIGVALYAETIANPDLVWGHATCDLLGGMGLGLVGLMISCLLAALMSSADTMMITAAGVLTRNVYRPLVGPRSEEHYVMVGRLFGGIILVGSVLLACWFETILQLMKFIWEFNAILAAAFWCGVKWRRANRIGAWASMVVTMMSFALLPLLLPALWPGLCTRPYLLKRTDPAPIQRKYTACQMDVDQQNQAIATWQSLSPDKHKAQVQPERIELGQTITKVIQPLRKSVFWSKDIGQYQGQGQGQGLLYLEMLVVDQFVDLSQLPYALVETIRTLIKIIMPFSVIIVVSLLTRPDDKARLDRFYSKMRTPVVTNRHEDEQSLAQSYADPTRFQERLLLPNSNFEFFRWNRIDVIGFGLCMAAVLAIVGFLYVLIHLGQ
jgi:SSS family solute:Na+ symporter